MRKGLSFITVTTLMLGSIVKGFASSPDLFMDATEIITSEYSQRDYNSYTFYNLKTDDVIIHNYGNSIESDYFVDGKSEGNQLVAVKYETTECGIVENAYFVNVESISTNDLIELVSEPTSASDLEKIEKLGAKSSEDNNIKRYSWSFYSTDIFDNQFLEATLTTTVTPTKQSGNSTINGTPCSVWDVRSFSQLEKVYCIRLCEQYTRLSVDLENQALLSHGPTGTSSGGEFSVDLTGGGLSDLSYSFSSGGISTKDLSSMANNYGRWAFIDELGNEPNFTTEPGIRASNTTGDFIVELSHTAKILSGFLLYENHGTGVIQIYLSDR